jgi:hypothetical protein
MPPVKPEQGENAAGIDSVNGIGSSLPAGGEGVTVLLSMRQAKARAVGPKTKPLLASAYEDEFDGRSPDQRPLMHSLAENLHNGRDS